MSDENTDEVYDRYRQQKQAYDQMEFEMSGRYDKWVLTLSGGALAISLTFLEKFSLPSPQYAKYFILASWFILAIGIGATLLSFLMSQAAFRRQKQMLDKSLEDKSVIDQKNNLTWWTNCLNICSLVSFFLGVFSLCIFVFVSMFE